ncbi:carboxymuconolactone decarboxylase family protein [Candidatus Dependentiae bacterium]|nr:carboxymuconolactone decarboxylase family protein [Candidatus Dependentiae bacterium]
MQDNKDKKDFSKQCYKNEQEQKVLRKGLRDYRKANPNFAKGFIELWRKSKEGTSIPKVYKELMELSITIVQRCRPCIFLHTRLCLEAGATIEQLLEATQVGVVMGGGPSYQYLGYVMEAIEVYKNKIEKKRGE